MKLKLLNNRIMVMVFLLILMSFSQTGLYGQLKKESFPLKWGSWLLFQAIPSPGFYDDRNESSHGVKFGLEWQVVPLSYSWSANKYVSKFSFFYIKPVKRFSGSAEIFFEPVLIPGGFKNNSLNKFQFKTGGRIVLPVFHGGEYLSVSAGAGYYEQRTPLEKFSGLTYEAAVYSFFGMAGLKFNYNQNALSRYSISLYIKYY